MKQKVFLVGNLGVEVDSSPLKFKSVLQSSFPQFCFLEFDPSEDFPVEDHLILVDTVINADRVRVLSNIKDVEKIVSSPQVSLHDFDLGFSLKLAKKLGNISRLSLICVPPNISEEDFLSQIRPIFQDLQTHNV